MREQHAKRIGRVTFHANPLCKGLFRLSQEYEKGYAKQKAHRIEQIR
jgi:hypothetical protein